MSESRHVEEGTIHAWLDGALPPDESRHVQDHVTSCAACAASVAEARGLVAASTRILSALDEVPGGVLPGRAEHDQLAAIRQRHQRGGRPWWRQRQVLAAASLVLVAGTSAVVWQRSQADARFPAVDVSPAPAASEVTESRPDQPAVLPDEKRVVAGRATEAKERLPVTPVPAPTAANERRADADAPTRQQAVTDAIARLEVAASPPTKAARDVAAPGRGMDSVALAKTVPTFPLQQQAGAGQAFEAARQRSLARSPTPFVANAPGGIAGGSMREGEPVASGCYELRGPDPVGGPLLGVPDEVRLRADTAGTDATWRVAESLDSLLVPTQLKWRVTDSLTVELRVMRPLDSTVVRFRTSATATPLQGADVPAGSLAATATRIVCR